jgi:DNA polymerase-3 subunit epsilon
MATWNLGPMVAFDLETTGVDVETARIVTACVALIDGSGQRPPDVTTWLVNPGIDIPEQATEIHGITTDHAREYGRPANECVREILSRLMHKTAPIVAFNACYDLTVLDRELRRYGIAPFMPAAQFVVDPFVLDKHLDRYRKGSRKLIDQCEHYGVRLDGAHDASHDAVAAARVAWRIAQRYPEIAAMGLYDLHNLQVEAKREQDASFAEYLRSQARWARDVDEQIALNARADTVAGHWPMMPYAGQAVSA